MYSEPCRNVEIFFTSHRIYIGSRDITVNNDNDSGWSFASQFARFSFIFLKKILKYSNMKWGGRGSLARYQEKFISLAKYCHNKKPCYLW